MEELYKLKDMLCEELKEYGGKGEMTAGSLEVVDKLAHTIKNLDKIIETYEEEDYSGYYPMYYGENRGGSYEGSYRQGDGNRGGQGNRSYRGSYARGRRNSRRDSMGRYSSEGYSRHDMAEQLRDLMEDAPDERTRKEIQRLVTKMEQM